MKFHKICCFCLIIIATISCISCTKTSTPQGNPNDDTGSLSYHDSSSAHSATKVLKDSTGKYDTLFIEGTREVVKLTAYRDANYGVETYIPAQDFLPKPTASGEGMSVRFISNFGGRKNEKAKINVFFPAGNPGIDQLRDMTIGPQGIFAMNKWRLIRSDKKVKLPYSWAQEQYFFQHRDGEEYLSGYVIIGESAGRAMQVIATYPPDYAEGFLPRSHILLKHLKISPLKEPGF